MGFLRNTRDVLGEVVSDDKGLDSLKIEVKPAELTLLTTFYTAYREYIYVEL
jgi:hypothetical protein